MSAQLELLDHKELKESKAKQVPQGQSEQQDLAVLLAQLVPQGLVVLLEQLELQVKLDLAVLLELLVQLDLAVQQAL